MDDAALGSCPSGLELHHPVRGLIRDDHPDPARLGPLVRHARGLCFERRPDRFRHDLALGRGGVLVGACGEAAAALGAEERPGRLGGGPGEEGAGGRELALELLVHRLHVRQLRPHLRRPRQPLLEPRLAPLQLFAPRCLVRELRLQRLGALLFLGEARAQLLSVSPDLVDHDNRRLQVLLRVRHRLVRRRLFHLQHLLFLTQRRQPSPQRLQLR
eukprot:3399416-Rhodomonas_salina.3